jgi:hypothetical protein
MATMSEPGRVEREAELDALRKRVRKAGRRGDKAEFDRLSAAYARLKAEHVTLTHEEYVAERRAVRAAQKALEARERPKPWKLPRGFGVSPLAVQRAREGRAEVVVPDSRRRALSPWRRSWSPMQERIWRP